MEIVGEGLKALGYAVGAWATAYGFIYSIGIIAKTFLIYTEKATNEQLKNWFDFKLRKENKL